MLDIIAKIFLSFGHEIFIIPLRILGYIWLEKEIFFNAICLILVSILGNFALKITFQVPLLPHLGQGFAFPSGHMQSAVVLYGWLIAKTRNFIYRVLMISVLIGIALSLVYCNYHNYFDVLGAIFFGYLLIFFYSLLANSGKQILLSSVVTLSTLLLLYILLLHKFIEEHLWMAYYALIGVVFSERNFVREITTKDLQNKIIATIICFTIIFITKMLCTIWFISSLPIFIQQIQWAIIGFSIPASVFISDFIKYQKCNFYDK